MPSPSVENYLKAIFHLSQRQEGWVKTKQLAERLEVSLPSATNMMQSLAEAGLVDYRPYHGVTLTGTGRLEALRVVRVHRLLEEFLVRTLGLGWDEVHDEAELLEHAVSDKLAARMDAFLGYPQVDPHGDPIPTADGDLVRSEGPRLAELQPGQRFRVVRVFDQDPERLRNLASWGLGLEGEGVVVAARGDAERQVKMASDSAPRWLPEPSTRALQVELL